MDTVSILTLRLAEGFGLYMIAAGIGGLFAPHRWPAMLADLERSPALTHITGAILFALGAAAFALHHGFHDPLAAAVTLIAAAMAIEGLLLIALPGLLFAVARPFMGAIRLWAILSIALGLLLFLLGALGRANPLP